MSDICLMAPFGDEYSTAPFFGFGFGTYTFEEYLGSPAVAQISPQMAGNWLYNVKALTISNTQEYQGDPEGGVLIATGTATTSLTQKDVGSLEFENTEVPNNVLRPRTNCIYLDVADGYFQYLVGWDIDIEGGLSAALSTFLGLSFFMHQGEFYAYFGGYFPDSSIEISMNQITIRNNSKYAEGNWLGSTEVFTILDTHYPVV